MHTRHVLCAISALVALTLNGCVWSSNPLSDPQEAKVDEDLFGVWSSTRDGRIDRYAIVGRPNQGKLPPGAMALQILKVDEHKSVSTDPLPFVFFIAKLGDYEYWNLLAHPEPFGRGWQGSLEKFEFAKWLKNEEHLYLLCRVEREKDQIKIFELESEATAKAVEDGKLKGKVSRDDKKIPGLSVYLSDSTENLQEFFATDAAKKLFRSVPDHTYKKLK